MSSQRDAASFGHHISVNVVFGHVGVPDAVVGIVELYQPLSEFERRDRQPSALPVASCRLHEVLGVQGGQFGGLVRREAEPSQALAAAVVHGGVQPLHGVVPACDGLRGPRAGGEHD